MNNTEVPVADEQLNALYLKNRELIEALKNLRKRLGGKDPDQQEEIVVAEDDKNETKEDKR